MVHFDAAPAEPRDEVREAVAAGLNRLVTAGTWWSGAERRDMAEEARTRRLGMSPTGSVADDLGSAVDVIAARPAGITRDFVQGHVARLGLGRYVEMLGVVSQITAIDTFTRTLGSEPFELPDAVPGEPTRRAVDVEKGPTWVPAGRFPSPPTVLAAVPGEVAAQNALSDVMYMTGAEMENPDWTRNGMHRAQAELAASAISHGNECFFWTGAHVGMLRVSARSAGYPLKIEAIVASDVDPGVPGGREILELAAAGLGTAASSQPISRLADAIGSSAAVEVAGAAANFEIMNRVVDGTGLPFGKGRARQMIEDLELLHMTEWPHNPLRGSESSRARDG